VIQAILMCILVHLEMPYRKRFSVLRREMLCVDNAAAAAAKNLRKVQTALDELTPFYRDAMFKQGPLIKQVEMPIRTALKLDHLSNIAHIYAQGFKAGEKGGAPKMLSFAMLVKGLARAYQRVTGKAAKVTWNDVESRYEGPFLRFFDAVLPL